MKVTVQVEGKTRSATLPEDYENAEYVTVSGTCPHCGVEPFNVRGGGIMSKDHDSKYAEASCLACGKHVGRMRVRFDTIFGIEEDERVLNGRYRVY